VNSRWFWTPMAACSRRSASAGGAVRNRLMKGQAPDIVALRAFIGLTQLIRENPPEAALLVPWIRSSYQKSICPAKRGEGRPKRFWQEPTPLSIGKCFVLAAHPRRGVPRFFPELASNLVVIVNKTYGRNHVYGD
jgi:hypothetical protein